MLGKILFLLEEIRNFNIYNNFDSIIDYKRDRIYEFCPFEVFREVVKTLRIEKSLLFDMWFEGLNEVLRGIYGVIFTSNLRYHLLLNEDPEIRKIVHVKKKI